MTPCCAVVPLVRRTGVPLVRRTGVPRHNKGHWSRRPDSWSGQRCSDSWSELVSAPVGGGSNCIVILGRGSPTPVNWVTPSKIPLSFGQVFTLGPRRFSTPSCTFDTPFWSQWPLASPTGTEPTWLRPVLSYSHVTSVTSMENLRLHIPPRTLDMGTGCPHPSALCHDCPEETILQQKEYTQI